MTDPLPQSRGELTMIERLYFTPRHAAPILDLPRMAALAEAATPGPRTIQNEPFETGMPYFYIRAGAGYWGQTDKPFGFEVCGIMSQADADLAALAPEILAALIRRVQAAEAELAATRAAIAEWRKEHWVATADTTLMETMDRIAEGILE